MVAFVTKWRQEPGRWTLKKNADEYNIDCPDMLDGHKSKDFGSVKLAKHSMRISGCDDLQQHTQVDDTKRSELQV